MDIAERVWAMEWGDKLQYHGIRVRYNYYYPKYTVTYKDGTKYWYRYAEDLIRSLQAEAPLLLPARCWITNRGGIPWIETVDWGPRDYVYEYPGVSND